MASDKGAPSKDLYRNSAVVRLLLDGKHNHTLDSPPSERHRNDSLERNASPMDLSQRGHRSPTAGEDTPALGRLPLSDLTEGESGRKVDTVPAGSRESDEVSPTSTPDGPSTDNESMPLQGEMRSLEREVYRGITQEMESLTRLPPTRMYHDSLTKWRCQYCPFSAAGPRVLHSHYQFHQQLLTSGYINDSVAPIRAASQSHLEWLMAYRKTRIGDGDKEAAASPGPSAPSPRPAPSTAGSDSYQSLRQLLAKGTDEQQQSASGFLRSIVQSIMQQGRETPRQGQAFLSADPTLPSRTPVEIVPRELPESSSFVSGHVNAPIKIEPDSEQDDRSSVLTDSDDRGGSVTSYSISSSQCEELSRGRGPCYPASEPEGDKPHPARYSITGALLAATLCQNEEDNKGKNKRKAPDDEDGVLVRQQLRSMIDKRRFIGPQETCSRSIGEVRLVNQMGGVSASDSEPSCSERTGLFSRPPPLTQIPAKRTDACVQCEILRPVLSRHDTGNPGDIVQEGDCGSSSTLVNPRCDHCGIQFDDEVLFSIHMGCHSHRDPFICNVCGRHCGNRYAFYTHIMRGHHS